MIRLYDRFRLIIAMLCIAVLAVSGSLPAARAAASSTQIDAVLVLDVSHSMSSSDPGNIGNEAMKLFIDMLSAKGDRVGIVAYSERIEREKALLEIRSPEDKENLKGFIDQLNRGSYTDIAVGVKEAVQILKDGAGTGHEPMIVVLADGNNEFNPKSGRTQADSDKDMEQALKEAGNSQIPVYTIGLNADGKLNKDALAAISEKTGAKSFSTDTADDLPKILSEIFASHMELNIVPVGSISANGAFQDVTVSVPNANVLEANISIMSSKPVETRLVDPSGAAVAVPSDNVLLSKSKSYSLVKLLHPAEGDWKLQIKGVNRDKIDINLVFNYDLELAIDPLPAKAYKKGDQVDVVSYLVSSGKKLQDLAQYSNMKAVLLVKDLDTGTTEQFDMKNTGEQFEGTFKLAQEHDYEIRVKAEESSFYRETAAVKVSAKPGIVSGSEESKPFPLVPVLLGVVALIIVLAAAYFIWRYMKQASRGFVGQLVVEIRDENTGDKSFPQYKKLSAFKGKLHLHQLLQLAPELKETEKIRFLPGSNDRIRLLNQSGCTIERSGRTLDASRGVELKSGDRITVALQQVDKTIFVEYLV
ncbi:VWA domain-containing protein [Paenibacillus sp. GCM10012307]|uniref:VWA domain-containing protein n=1 Tax=Paenibacillus roseus TaxID=2798579 RepID=A0A934MUC8_9BACL|nr:vWA domain-containing protein [Paenibacillus roseus]MBJ6360957.1 VWA domain-containing protein [Paenibacillus roseus]